MLRAVHSTLSDAAMEVGILVRPQNQCTENSFRWSAAIRIGAIDGLAVLGGQVWAMSNGWMVFGVVGAALGSALCSLAISATSRPKIVIALNVMTALLAGVSSACQINFPYYALPMLVLAPLVTVLNWEGERGRKVLNRVGLKQQNQ